MTRSPLRVGIIGCGNIGARIHLPTWLAHPEVALADIGYDDVLSIENEDPLQPQQVGAKEAADFITELNVER